MIIGQAVLNWWIVIHFWLYFYIYIDIYLGQRQRSVLNEYVRKMYTFIFAAVARTFFEVLRTENISFYNNIGMHMMCFPRAKRATNVTKTAKTRSSNESSRYLYIYTIDIIYTWTAHCLYTNMWYRSGQSFG